jgi:soluble P-type ATPase
MIALSPNLNIAKNQIELNNKYIGLVSAGNINNDVTKSATLRIVKIKSKKNKILFFKIILPHET